MTCFHQVQEGFLGYNSPTTLAVPSESLRLELASTLATTSAVRDVHSVETAFAITCAGRLERLLRGIEKETFQHLETLFPPFLESTHYLKLVTEYGCRNSKKIQEFKKKLAFLKRLKLGQAQDGLIVDAEYEVVKPPASELQGDLYAHCEIASTPLFDEGCFVLVLGAQAELSMASTMNRFSA